MKSTRVALATLLLTLLACAVAAPNLLFKYAGDRTDESADALVALLEDAGADPRAVSDDGETALHMSCIWGSAKKVRALLNAGADPNARASKNPASLDMTPLTWCSYAGYTEAIAAFLAVDATAPNLVVREESGGRLTALDIARKIGPRGADAAALLVGAGAKTYAELLADAGGVASAVPGLPPGDAQANDEL